jgi:hypothetical protein
MDIRENGWGCRVDSIGSVQGRVAVCWEYGDKSSDADATDLVSWLVREKWICHVQMRICC